MPAPESRNTRDRQCIEDGAKAPPAARKRSLGSYSDVLLEPLRLRFASVHVAVLVDCHELCSITRNLSRITPWIQYECVDPARSCISDTDSFFPTWILHVIGFRI